MILINSTQVICLLADVIFAIILLNVKLNHRKLLDGMMQICGVEEKGLTVETADRIGTFVREKGHPLTLLEKLKQEGSLDYYTGVIFEAVFKGGVEINRRCEMGFKVQFLVIWSLYRLPSKLGFSFNGLCGVYCARIFREIGVFEMTEYFLPFNDASPLSVSFA
ncbi:putative histidine--tRNA ligase [Medicago truncatula]|uniref:Putative histidine--tRNA ligase n=1 Tax=Medicago truncatula TaxID=3880 RepID=A0A396JT36_MEDTR|nr:putative histidine--tRNA ligase [Medicago truncatula]